MPRTSAVFYREPSGEVPVLQWSRAGDLAILGHAITKEDVVPETEIDRRLRRKQAFESDPDGHSYSE